LGTRLGSSFKSTSPASHSRIKAISAPLNSEFWGGSVMCVKWIGHRKHFKVLCTSSLERCSLFGITPRRRNTWANTPRTSSTVEQLRICRGALSPASWSNRDVTSRSFVCASLRLCIRRVCNLPKLNFRSPTVAVNTKSYLWAQEISQPHVVQRSRSESTKYRVLVLPQYTLNTVFWTNEDLIVADYQLRSAKIHFLCSSNDTIGSTRRILRIV